jgi:hypothetical protein
VVSAPAEYWTTYAGRKVMLMKPITSPAQVRKRRGDGVSAVCMPAGAGVAGGDARITHPADATIVAISVPSNTPSVRLSTLGVWLTRPCVGRSRTRSWVSEGPMTISSSEGVCSCRRWEVPDGHNIAAHAVASCCITGRGWVLNRSQEM